MAVYLNIEHRTSNIAAHEQMKKQNLTAPPLTLEELDALCRKDVKVVVPGPQGARIEVMIRRLTPQETARVRELREAVVPPVVTDESGKRDYDFTDREYARKLSAAAVAARSLAIWLGCAWFRQGAPADTGESTARIEAYVQGRLTDSLLELICQKIMESDGRLEDEVDFFSAPASRSGSGTG